MKKIMMTLAAAVVAMSASAQVYLGGNIGFNSTSDKTNPAAEKTSTMFQINPEIGYSLNDKWGVGVELGFRTTTDKTENPSANTSNKATTTRFHIKPYARYQAFSFGKANVFVDGGLNFATESQKDMKAALDFGLFVTPGIAFNVTEKWSIVAKLNDMFTLGYHKDAIADVPNAPSAPSQFNANIATGGFNVGALTFGVYYNF